MPCYERVGFTMTERPRSDLAVHPARMFVTKLVHLAINIPVIRFGIVMVFVVFEVFFWGFTYMFFAGTRGLFPRGAILIANTLAAVVMAAYLWRRHPSLKRALRHEPLGF